jgi:hypothetical protein
VSLVLASNQTLEVADAPWRSPGRWSGGGPATSLWPSRPGLALSISARTPARLRRDRNRARRIRSRLSSLRLSHITDVARKDLTCRWIGYNVVVPCLVAGRWE